MLRELPLNISKDVPSVASISVLESALTGEARILKQMPSQVHVPAKTRSTLNSVLKLKPL